MHIVWRNEVPEVSETTREQKTLFSETKKARKETTRGESERKKDNDKKQTNSSRKIRGGHLQGPRMLGSVQVSREFGPNSDEIGHAETVFRGVSVCGRCRE